MNRASSNRLEDRVLILLPFGAVQRRVVAILGQAKLPCHVCSDMLALCKEMEQGAACAVLSMELLGPPALKTLIKAIEGQASWSDFPLLVLRDRDEPSSAVALRRLLQVEHPGNVTVLQRPISAFNLASAVRTAVHCRRRQYQTRTLLEQTVNALQQRDRLLCSLVRELHDPLGALCQATQELEHQPNRASEQSATIERQVVRLAQLIDKTTDVYQILAGNVRLKREPVEFVALTSACLASMAAEARARRHQVKLTKEAEELCVEGDGRRLEQVVRQLLSNAIRYTLPGGWIELKLTRETGQAVLRVRDSGTGLTQQELKQLFEPFSEITSALKQPTGTGLRIGLTLAQRLVELHGGSMSATSAGPGQGSEFVLRFPLLHSAPKSGPSAPRVESTCSRRVLVIEDNRDARESLRLLLQLWGHEVEAVGDGPQGLQNAQAKQPEVILVDIGLPGMDGYEVARRLRSSLGRSALLVAITGYSHPRDRQQAIEAGFDNYLVKPANPSVLQELLVRPSMTQQSD